VAVACECHAKAFLHEGAWVVVDVLDGPAPEGVAGVVAPGDTPAAPEAVAMRLPTGPLIPLLPEAARPEPLLGALAAEREGRLPARDAAPDPSPEDARRLAATEAAMLEGARRRRHRGLPRPRLPPDALLEPEPPSPVPPLAPEAPAAGPAPRPAAGPGVALRTASTRPGGAPMGAGGEACLPPGDFDLAAWAPTGDFGGGDRRPAPWP
jgi:hypothetical protein